MAMKTTSTKTVSTSIDVEFDGIVQTDTRAEIVKVSTNLFRILPV